MITLILYPYKETISGFAAGVFGTLLGFPLDTIKTRMQTAISQSSNVNNDKNKVSIRTIGHAIFKEDGIRGFYRGVLSPLFALTILNMLNFSSYAYFKRVFLMHENGPTEKSMGAAQYVPIRIFLAGAAAGPLAAMISTPFEYIKIQMQIRKINLVPLIRLSNLRALYSGHAVNTTREAVFLGTYFMTYEHFKSMIAEFMPNSIAIPFSGGLSGAIGWFISFPLDCIKSKIQSLDNTNTTTAATSSAINNINGININSRQNYTRKKSAIAIARELVKSKGLIGLYSGVTPSIARAFIVSSSRFSAYEFTLSMFE